MMPTVLVLTPDACEGGPPAPPPPPPRAEPWRLPPAREVLALNDAGRADPGAAALLTADDVCGADASAARRDGALSVLYPLRWAPPRRVGQAEYAAEFARRDPLAAAALRRVNQAGEGGPVSVVVAGGAAAAPYFDPDVEAGDVDFFVVAGPGAGPADLWSEAYGLAHVLHSTVLMHELGDAARGAAPLFPGLCADAVSASIAPGLITIEYRLRGAGESGGGVPFRRRKYQIVLRAYPSVSAVLHGADLGACAVAFDGATARLSALGAHAQLTRVNLVNPAYCSATFERRLGKYFGRGYALGLPLLRAGALRAPRLALPRLTLAVAAARGPRQAVGGLEVPKPAPDAAAGYDPVIDEASFGSPRAPFRVHLPDGGYFDTPAGDLFRSARANARQLAARTRAFVMCFSNGDLLAPRDSDVVDIWVPFMQPWVNYSRVPTTPPTLGEFLPEAVLDQILASAGAHAYAGGVINTQALSAFLGLTPREVAAFAAKTLALAAAHPGRAVGVADALRPFRDEIKRRYAAACAEPIEWWAPAAEPLTPLRAATPAEWYGAENLAGGLDEPEEPAEPGAADDAHSAGEFVYDRFATGECSICLGPLVDGASNSVVLRCGHGFHWARDFRPAFWAAVDGAADAATCEGLYAWIGGGRSTCPVCRAEFATPREVPALTEVAAPAVALAAGFAAAPPEDAGPPGA